MSSSSFSNFNSPPEKPPRLYLPLSLSEWDLRARSNGQKNGKGKNENNSGSPWRSNSAESRLTTFEMRKDQNKRNIVDIRIEENNGEMKDDECIGIGIMGASSKQWQNHPNEYYNTLNKNGGMQRKSIITIGGDDNLSITSSTGSAPPYRQHRLTSRLLNHSQSLAKMFTLNAFRSRSKSARITARKERRPSENWQQMTNNGEYGNETEMGGSIPPLGEHSAWLRSRGIFGKEERPKEEEDEGIWLIGRSQSVVGQNGRKFGQWNGGIEEEKWTTIFVSNKMEDNMICTRL